MTKHLSFRHYALAVLVAFIASLWIAIPIAANSRVANDDANSKQDLLQSASQSPPSKQADEFCLGCHQVEGVFLQLDSGENLNLSVDREMLASSIHGQENISCTECHSAYTGYPHTEQEFENVREFIGSQNNTCMDCHENSRDKYLEGVHQAGIEEGNVDAAYCSDCHGSHSVESQNEISVNPAQVCGDCHLDTYELYAQSVHGEALIGEGNRDVPSCLDCHGAHEINSAASNEFHLFSPQLCASCHADAELTAKYDLNPNVFDSYVADFHGTTVVLFENVSPDQETNKPVCIDCHGVHDIRASDDPESLVVRENLLSTCQRCHPDATDDFPDAWLSHYQPSWESTPVVTSVNLFYQIVIPSVVLGMLIFIIPDGLRMLRKRNERKSNE